MSDANAAPETYEISTLEDMARVYSKLPHDRGELMLKEIAAVVRMMAPVMKPTDADGADTAFLPVTWINDTEGKATVDISVEGEVRIFTVSGDLPDASQ